MVVNGEQYLKENFTGRGRRELKFFKAITLLFCLCFFMAITPNMSMAEEAGFKAVLAKKASKIYLSADFTEDGKGFVFVEERNAEERTGWFLYGTKDGGRTWKKIRWLVDNVYWDEGAVYLRTLAWTSNGSIYLTGSCPGSGAPFLLLSKNEGDRWETVSSGPDAPLAVWTVGERLLGAYPVKGAPYVIYVSSDGGKTWPSSFCAGILPDSRCFTVLDENTYFAILDNYSLKVTRDGGDTWQNTNISLSESQKIKGEVAVAQEISGIGTVVACSPGTSAGVYISQDKGITWKRVDSAQFEWRPKHTASRVLCVTAAPGGLIFAGTPDDCVMVSENYGTTWKPVTGGIFDEVIDIKCAPAGNSVVVFAVTQDGLLRMEYRKQLVTEDPDQQLPKQYPDHQPEKEDQSEKPIIEPIKFVVGQKVYYVGEQSFVMDAKAFTETGRTYVPVRYLSNALGAETQWNKANQMAALVKDEVTVKLIVGNNTIDINGQVKKMDVTPLIRNGRIYLPARYVAEAFGYSVNWDSTAQTVNIVKVNKA